MNDLATLTLQPRPITVGGKTYLIHPFTVGDLGKLQAWVDTQFGNPLAIAADNMEHFTVPQQKHLMAVAIEQASKPKPKIGSEEADALCRSLVGLKQSLFIGISKGDPAFKVEEVDALFDALSPEQLGEAFSATQVDKVLSDPKAETSGESP